MSPASSAFIVNNDLIQVVLTGSDDPFALVELKNSVASGERWIPWTLVYDVFVEESLERLPVRGIDRIKQPHY